MTDSITLSHNLVVREWLMPSLVTHWFVTRLNESKQTILPASMQVLHKSKNEGRPWYFAARSDYTRRCP